MCDHESFENLENRVDSLENRLTKVETEVTSMRSECRDGFDDLKKNFDRVYEDRLAWSQWSRENLPSAARAVGKWIIILVFTAIGVNNIPTILKLFIKELN